MTHYTCDRCGAKVRTAGEIWRPTFTRLNPHAVGPSPTNHDGINDVCRPCIESFLRRRDLTAVAS